MRLFNVVSPLACLVASLWAVPAGAHIQVTYPPPREGGSTPQLKTAPCGTTGVARSTDPTRISTFRPGETITVRFTETVGHPGHFRIAFDDNGQDAFVDPSSFTDIQTTPVLPILKDGIADMARTGTMYQVAVTLPAITCARCTLQVIQVMTDKPPYTLGGDDVYHQCIDIVLADGDGGTSAPADAAAPRAEAAPPRVDGGPGRETDAGGPRGESGASGAGGAGGAGQDEPGAPTASGGAGGESTGAAGSGGASSGSSAGGAATAGASAGEPSGPSGADAGGPAPNPADDGGGCAVSRARGSRWGITAPLAALGLATWVARRRRSRRRDAR